MSEYSNDKCSHCHGSICCSYITHQIETPRSRQSFDYLLWQISHKNIEIYKDEDGWFLLINNPCTHLKDDGSCGIYHDRPEICRTHTNDYCELDASAVDGFELYFADYHSLLIYCKKRFKTWDQRLDH